MHFYLLIIRFFFANSTKMSIFALLNHQIVTIMKKYLLSTYLVLFSVLLTIAAPVDEQSARKIASDFLQSKMPHVTRAASGELTRAVTGVADGDNAGIYVFNADNSFVIVSADDRTPSVLGYSDNGVFDMNTAPEALKVMLSKYQQAVSSNQAITRGTVPTHDAIKALVKTKWNQYGPYNLTCPKDNTTGKTSLTGCVATAMAQVMYYHQWPATYEWSKMKTEYASNDSTESAYAVAKLMADAGAAVGMNYSSDGSYTSDLYACEALRNIFSYALSTEYSSRTNYTATEWDALIYDNLANAKPVLYSAQAIDIDDSGAGVQAGHAFVVDGYDGAGLYHVNWGWGGLSDGFFMLSLMNPDNQGAGGTSGSAGYNIDQTVIVGIAPSTTTNMTVERLLAMDFTINNQSNTVTLSRTSTTANFKQFMAQCLMFSHADKDLKYDIGLALYQGDKLVKMLGTTSEDIPAGKGGYYNNSYTIGGDLVDGTYQLRPICRETGQTDFVLQIQGMDCYATIVINGLSMQVTPHGGVVYSGDTKFLLNSKEVSTDNMVGRPITFKLNLTDKNSFANAPVFLWGNEDATKTVLLAGIGSNLDAGETGDVTISYIPQREGTYKFYFSTSASDYKDAVALDSVEVNVAAAPVFDLVVDVTFDVEGASADHVVSGTALKGVAKIKNNSTETYYGGVRIWLLQQNSSDNMYYSTAVQTNTAEIKVGETGEVPFQFEGLDTDTSYAFYVMMLNKGEYEWVNGENGYLTSTCVYKLTSETGIQNIQLETPDADVYDMRGVKLGKASELNSLPKGIYIINKKKVVNK